MKKVLSLLACVGLSLALNAQNKKLFGTKDGELIHTSSESYEWPTDTKVLEKLDKWQDVKFGIMYHWGIYSVPGITESWLLCSEDRFTKRRQRVAQDKPYDEFKKWYWGLADSFNPVKFEPSRWADIAKEAGCKYLIFTTKHHDGFCMYDSKYTDYSITKGPYKNGKYSDVTKHLFDAFRDKGFMIGTYFSKPDWHNTDYWDPFWATPTRNANYDIKKYPKKWANFQKFTANQIDELMSNYGAVDILWLDGGWVRKPEEDIKLDDIVDKAREKQPGLIVADRTIPGRNENYQTPERVVPEKQINNPWETNIPLAKTWGWSPNSEYKSCSWVINMLAEIVAKGGNLALNIGPTPEGEIEQGAIDRLKEVGAWLNQNGAAIYATRTTPNYNYDKIWFTANKDGKTLYAIYALPENETVPATIEWQGNEPAGKMTLLQNGKSVKYSCKEGKVVVTLPKGLKNEPLAFSFKVKK